MLVFRDWQNVPILVAYANIHRAQIREARAFYVVIDGPPVRVGGLIRDIESFWNERAWNYVHEWNTESIFQNTQTRTVSNKNRFDIDLSRSLQSGWRIDIGVRRERVYEKDIGYNSNNSTQSIFM